MDNNILSLEERLAKLDNEYPLVPHTNESSLSSIVRRMKAEKEMDIPVNHRTGFAVSAKVGKAADKMAEQVWELFYKYVCEQLKEEYPQIFRSVFPDKQC